ncbi:hypothetical protein M758_9G173500 [Ceratodon purpureus]|nr:hypothetical protein M758_9G173500 [Ceratodon purpureus]
MGRGAGAGLRCILRETGDGGGGSSERHTETESESVCAHLRLSLSRFGLSLYFLLFPASLPLATRLLLFTLRFVFSLGPNNVFAHIVFNGLVYPKKKSPH